MMDDKEFIELKQGDKLELEFSFQFGDEDIHASSWLIASSQDCVVNFHKITDERLKLVRHSSLAWHEKYLSEKAEKCGGKLTTKEIEDYFKKHRFVSRLHDGNN